MEVMPFVTMTMEDNYHKILASSLHIMYQEYSRNFRYNRNHHVKIGTLSSFGQPRLRFITIIAQNELENK
jgi:hypothetical protein